MVRTLRGEWEGGTDVSAQNDGDRLCKPEEKRTLCTRPVFIREALREDKSAKGNISWSRRRCGPRRWAQTDRGRGCGVWTCWPALSQNLKKRPGSFQRDPHPTSTQRTEMLEGLEPHLRSWREMGSIVRLHRALWCTGRGAGRFWCTGRGAGRF